MITDLLCAELCAEIYGDSMRPLPAARVVAWEHLDEGEDDGVCWGLMRTQDQDVIVLRGSATTEDWIRDLLALASPFTHHLLGPVHPGFLLGMEHAWTEMKRLLRNGVPTVITGHSLGAGRASILCGLMLLEGLVPARRVCFGSPKPGFDQLAELIRKVPSASYRNGSDWHHDLVTDVPFSFPPEEYTHPESLTFVAAAPEPGDPLGPFAYHHVELYVKALGKLGAPPNK